MTVNDVDCCYIIPDINKPEAINLLENSVLEDCLYIQKNIFRFLAWHTKFEKCKALKKKYKQRINARSVVSENMVEFLHDRR